MFTAANKLTGTDYSRYMVINTLNVETICKAKDIFDKYVAKGVILSGSFENNTWILTDEKSSVRIRFSFSDIEYNKHAENWIECTSKCYREAIKAYILFHLGSLSLASLRELAYHLCQVAYSDFPSEDGFGDESAHILEVLQIIPGVSEERNAAIECLEECSALHRKAPRGNQRKILAFKAYFQFHDALNEYWKSAGIEDRRFYFPLYLWWKFTAILPLRVTEFLLIPRDCIQKAKNGYFVTVRRTRLKGGNTLMSYRIDSDYEKKIYPISDEIAEEILWYKTVTKKTPNESIDSLFCYEEYQKRHKLSIGDFFCYEHLAQTKKDFYTYALKGKNIPVVQLGDTRHIAMMNLIISGGSPTMCMALAGHANISISSHYYTNMASLIECATYELYRKNKKGTSAIFTGNNQYSLESFEKMIKIPEGWCSSKNMRTQNVDDCLLAVNSIGEFGDCKSCCYFHSDRHARRFDFYDQKQWQQKITADSWFLMHMIDAVRQGIGYKENIHQAILRLQHSCNQYKQFLLYQYEEKENG